MATRRGSELRRQAQAEINATAVLKVPPSHASQNKHTDYPSAQGDGHEARDGFGARVKVQEQLGQASSHAHENPPLQPLAVQ